MQHGVHGARLFADRNHLRDHARENVAFLQRLGQRLALFERLSDLYQCLLNNRVAGRSGSDVQTFQDWHAAGNQRSQGSGEAGDSDLSHQQAKNRHFEDDRVQNKAALRRPIPYFQPENAADHSH